MRKKKVKKKVKKKKAKKKAGRKKAQFTKVQKDMIADAAFHGCQTGTIATLTGIPDSTLRDNFRDLLAKKRAERKLYLRKSQNKEVSKGNSAILIFLGKNELEQTDTKDQNINAVVEIRPIKSIKEIRKTMEALENAGTGLATD